MYAKWVQSYRDLPILINQWANVVRWEMRTRMFLRTAEFLWQEGHTAHATERRSGRRDDADARRLCDVRRRLHGDAGDLRREDRGRAVPRRGEHVQHRSDDARPQGAASRARRTSSARILPRRRRSSSKATRARKNLPGRRPGAFRTRLIGGLIMTHSDDDGLVLPPRLAPQHVVILPIYRTDEEKAAVMEYCESLKKELQAVSLRRRAGPRDDRRARSARRRQDVVPRQARRADSPGSRPARCRRRRRLCRAPRSTGQEGRPPRRVRRGRRRDAGFDSGEPARTREEIPR